MFFKMTTTDSSSNLLVEEKTAVRISLTVPQMLLYWHEDTAVVSFLSPAHDYQEPKDTLGKYFPDC
jgi:hypothetical protein